MYYFTELAGTIANIALLVYLLGKVFWKKELPSWMYYTALAILTGGLYGLSLFPTMVLSRTFYLLVCGLLFSLFFFETSIWQAAFASAAFIALCTIAEVLVYILLSLYVPDIAALTEAGNARIALIVLAALVEIPLVILISNFLSKKENALGFRWIFPILAIQFTSIGLCYVVVCHAADENFPHYLIPFMAVLLIINIAVVFYVETVRASEQAKYHAMLTEQQYQLQTEYYRQLYESQEETKALWHDIKKYILAMQAVTEKGDTEGAKRIVKQATDAFNEVKNISAVGNPVVDAVFNKYLRCAQELQTKVTLDVTIPEVLPISPIDLSIMIGNTFDNALEACLALSVEQRKIQICLRKQNRILFYRITNPYTDNAPVERNGKYHGYGLKNVKRIIEHNGGDFQVEKTSGFFTVSIRMNCEI